MGMRAPPKAHSLPFTRDHTRKCFRALHEKGRVSPTCRFQFIALYYLTTIYYVSQLGPGSRSGFRADGWQQKAGSRLNRAFGPAGGMLTPRKFKNPPGSQGNHRARDNFSFPFCQRGIFGQVFWPPHAWGIPNPVFSPKRGNPPAPAQGTNKPGGIPILGGGGGGFFSGSGGGARAF